MAKLSLEALKARFQETVARARESFQGFRDKLRERFPSRQADGADPLIQEPMSGFGKWKTRLVQHLPQATEMAMAAMEKAMDSLRKGGFGVYGKATTVVLCAWFTADVAAILLEELVPEPPPAAPPAMSAMSNIPKSLTAYNPIFTRNLFNSRGLIPGENQPGQTAPRPGSPDGPCDTKTTLALNLVGTIITRDKVHSLATIEDRGGSDVYPVRVQDEIPSKIRVLEIAARKVCFINLATGAKEYVDLPEDAQIQPARRNVPPPRTSGGSAGVTQVSPTQFNVSRSVIDTALGDLNKVLTQARAIPHFENGMPAGYKLFQIVPGSPFDVLGMVNGDVIAGVNGDPVKDPSKAFELLNELKTSNHVEINIKRNGQEQTLVYNIN